MYGTSGELPGIVGHAVQRKAVEAVAVPAPAAGKDFDDHQRPLQLVAQSAARCRAKFHPTRRAVVIQ